MLDIYEAMRERHSVRSYLDKPIKGEVRSVMQRAVEEINRDYGVNFQLCLDRPEVFSGPLAHYGTFSGCSNFIALVAGKDQDELVGYCGEKLVLLAQQLGLNSCWAALTYNKSKVKAKVNKGEKLHLIIALGYGATKGVPRRSKRPEELGRWQGDAPDWFLSALECAMLAPTAINQQKFILTLDGDTVTARAIFGPYSTVDLGIVKYHFELGAKGHSFTWA